MSKVKPNNPATIAKTKGRFSVKIVEREVVKLAKIVPTLVVVIEQETPKTNKNLKT